MVGELLHNLCINSFINTIGRVEFGWNLMTEQENKCGIMIADLIEKLSSTQNFMML